MQDSAFKTLYYNEPQLEVFHTGAHRTYCIWGRGTGKTSNALAPYFLRLVQQMPRGLFSLVGASYAQILGRVLPAMISGWERMGYKRNVHFFVRKFAPEKHGWNRSYMCPEVGTHLIHWYNGAVIQFVSQDRPNLANGLSFDGMGGDEARFLNYDQLLELIPALRGNRVHFGHLSAHQSQMFTTDMPQDHRGSWLFEQEEYSLSKEKQQDILTLSLYLSTLYQQQYEAPQARKHRFNASIKQTESALNALRKGTTFFSLASTLDNIYALGADAIQTMQKTMPKKRFETAVLNLKRTGVEMGFYGLFDPARFGYYGDNHSFLDDPRFIFGSQRDCRWDKFFNPKKGLDIGADFGGNFNCCVVGQEFKKMYRILNNFWAEHPEGIDAVVKQVIDYYQFTERKEVNFYHDHTAYGDGVTYLDEWRTAFQRHGWTFNAINIGHTQRPNERYLLWMRTFKNDPDIANFTYHQNTCQDLETAIQLTGIVEGKKGAFDKDKSTEKRDGAGNFPIVQQHAPHLTDALDTLWVGTQFHKLDQFNGWMMPEMVVG